MADFCQQCSIEVFGEDFKDLADIARGERLLHTLCEGCADAIVNSVGRCVAANCLKHHGDRE